MATGIIILAAGASTRLGSPKQNLFYKGSTLLEHTVDTALEARCCPVVAVLGAHADNILSHIQTKPVIIAHNTSWQQGMSSSVITGLSAILREDKDVAAVIIVLCDQPFADASLLARMILQKTQTGKGIVACRYAGTIGVPGLFDKKYFNELLALKGDEGAKKLFYKYEGDTAIVAFEKGSIDIDTMKDYEGLKEQEK